MSYRLKDLQVKPDPKENALPDSHYPYGLAISLSEVELEKLGLDGDVEVGDFLHGQFMAKVTSVHHHSRSTSDGSEKGCRVELQIMAIGIEDENTEFEDDEEDED